METWSQRKMNRRHFLQAAAAVSATTTILPILDACGSTTTTNSIGTKTKPLVIANIEGVPTLDPDLIIADTAVSLQTEIFDTLVDYDETSKQVVPRMATSWKVVNDTTIEFKLRSGMKFTNGEACDANAVKFTVDRTLNPATKSLRSTVLQNVVSVDVVDPLTARFNLKQPDPLLIQYMITYAILPPNFTTQNSALLATAPVGSGPYKVSAFQSGYQVVLVRNDGYWGPKPAFQYAVYRTLASSESQLASLLAGDIHIASNLDPVQAKTLGGNSKFRVVSKPKLLQAVITLDQIGRTDPKGPMTDQRVRQAVNQAVNFDAIINDILLGHGTRLAAGVCPFQFGFDPTVEPWPYDPATAKQLLSAAGYPNGFEARIISQNGGGIVDQPQTAQAIQSDLAAVGITMSILNMTDPSAVGALVMSGKAGPMIQLGNAAGGVYDAGADYSFIFQCGNPFSYYCNSQFGSLNKQQASTLDQTARQATLSQMQKFIHDDAGALFEWSVHGICGVSSAVNWPSYSGRQEKLYTARPA